MNTVQVFWKFTWRTTLVALGYLLGTMLAGIISAMLGAQIAGGSGKSGALPGLFIGSMLLGLFIGPIALRLSLTRLQHIVLWTSLIIFNLGSVALEGAYFAPALVTIPVPMLLAQQLLAALGAALLITLVFTRPGQPISWMDALRSRPWFSWLWRLIASALSYLAFYFVFGGLNYSLVTKPYYETHAGGLTVPAPQVVFILESIRGLLIVFSVFLFLLSVRGPRRQLIGTTGWLLFAIGGVIPLIWQLNTLPPFLLFASAIEIFCQNFLTGAVAALLMGIEKAGATGA